MFLPTRNTVAWAKGFGLMSAKGPTSQDPEGSGVGLTVPGVKGIDRPSPCTPLMFKGDLWY